ncbi:hypothetical protein BT96DRAFT_950227 [Gymnopus androsaceus JB14]|uniref:Uncharacterized protein n=1 Tax=Gymnopus androsaceus JB14 TaxID=1447944 RepID=A0A6A4GHG9_9AGAR|nr:hypothetical protein BT96DRAFT_950227 [Gymnopus androsaceus JB14]
MLLGPAVLPASSLMLLGSGFLCLPPFPLLIVRGPTIRIPPPALRSAPHARPQAPPVPLRVGDTVIPPGSDLARELEAFEATEAQFAAASKAHFFKEQEQARVTAAETKRRLEAEQQRREQREVQEHWEVDMREKERAEKDARREQKRQWKERLRRMLVESKSDNGRRRLRGMLVDRKNDNSERLHPQCCVVWVWCRLLSLLGQSHSSRAYSVPVPSVPLPSFSLPPIPPADLPDHWSPVPRRGWSPARVLERPGLDGDAYHRVHIAIASGDDPAVADLRNAYGDRHRLDLPNPARWEPLPPMPVLRNHDIGPLQQELLDMQRRLNSAQLDLETEWACNRMATVQTRHLEAQLADLRRLNSEQERMMKNRQVEYELLQGEVKTLADSAAASAASAAQAKAYKALLVPGYPDPSARIEDLEDVLSRYEVELRRSEEGRGEAVDRAIRREVEIGNTSQLIHDLMGTCELLRQRARSAERRRSDTEILTAQVSSIGTTFRTRD